MKILKNTALVLSTGAILVYFSENLFWARIRPDDSLLNWLSTWAAYSLVAFVFLTLLAYFRVDNPWALFLAGAAVGWLAEGLIVQTAYESLPLSLSFTGLAWHALISVWVGWYGLRKSLFSPDRLATLKLSALAGLCYGLWAICWWLEPDGGIASIQEFVLFSLVSNLVFIAGCWLANWASLEPFAPNRLLTFSIAGLFLIYFFFVTVPAAPAALFILPLLLGLVILGLRLSQRSSLGAALPGSLAGRPRLTSYLSLLALPLAASLVYALAFTWHIQLQTNWILYILTTPLGFIIFTLGLYRAWRSHRQNSFPQK